MTSKLSEKLQFIVLSTGVTTPHYIIQSIYAVNIIDRH